MAERIEMTADGKARLEEELKNLIEVEEPELVKSLGEAAAQGDLRENFAYHDIRRQLGLMRGRISELRNMLAGAYVVVNTAAASDGRIRLGSVVVIKEEGFDEEEEYVISTEAETTSNSQRSDGKNSVSSTSPMGHALIGKKAGDKAQVRTPRGTTLTFTIVKVN